MELGKRRMVAAVLLAGLAVLGWSCSRSEGHVDDGAFEAPSRRMVGVVESKPDSESRDREMTRVDKLVEQVRMATDQPVDRVKYATGWLYSSLRLASPTRADRTSETTLTLMAAACGHRDFVLHTVAEGLGIRASRAGFLNIPVQGSHAATQVAVGHRWLFFDATFGIFFAHPRRPDEPLSLDRARELYPNIVVMRARVPEYTGEWLDVPTIDYEPIDVADVLAVTGHGYTADQSVDLFERTYIASEVFGRRRAEPYLPEVPLPLDTVPEGALGDRDGSSYDLNGSQIDLGYGETYLPYFQFVGNYWNDGPRSPSGIN